MLFSSNEELAEYAEEVGRSDNLLLLVLFQLQTTLPAKRHLWQYMRGTRLSRRLQMDLRLEKIRRLRTFIG